MVFLVVASLALPRALMAVLSALTAAVLAMPAGSVAVWAILELLPRKVVRSEEALSALTFHPRAVVTAPSAAVLALAAAETALL